VTDQPISDYEAARAKREERLRGLSVVMDPDLLGYVLKYSPHPMMLVMPTASSRDT
jgi:hypothetical protein